MRKKVALFGDSILKGIVYNDNHYTVNREINWEMIENELNVDLDNQSKMGIRAEKGKERIIKYIEKHPDLDVMVLEFGGNDSDYDWAEVAQNKSKDHNPFTLLEDFKEEMISIITLLREYGIRPILMTLPPIDPKRYYTLITSKTLDTNHNIMYFLGDVEIIYRRQELYSNAIFDIARVYNVEIVDVRKKYLESADFNNLICDDGIHPNQFGQNIIIDTFIEYFKN